MKAIREGLELDLLVIASYYLNSEAWGPHQRRGSLLRESQTGSRNTWL